MDYKAVKDNNRIVCVLFHAFSHFSSGLGWRLVNVILSLQYRLLRTKHGWFYGGPGIHIVIFCGSHDTQQWNITTKYYEIFGRCNPSHATIIYPHSDGIFWNDKAPVHTVHIILYWFYENVDSFANPSWLPQLPKLTILNLQRLKLENNVRGRYSPQLSFSEVVKIIQEEW